MDLQKSPIFADPKEALVHVMDKFSEQQSRGVNLSVRDTLSKAGFKKNSLLRRLATQPRRRGIRCG